MRMSWPRISQSMGGFLRGNNFRATYDKGQIATYDGDTPQEHRRGKSQLVSITPRLFSKYW